MIKVLFVCHGNICRSTMAESVFTYLVTQAGLASHFEINSAATSREEIGNPPHYGTVDKLRREHIPLIPHHARQMMAEDYRYYDYLIGMSRHCSLVSCSISFRTVSRWRLISARRVSTLICSLMGLIFK